MRTSKTIGFYLTAILLVIGNSALGDVMSEAIKPLLQVEKDFAADVDSTSIRDGFLHYLAKDAIIFAPGPVNAHDFYENREATSARMLWTPQTAEMDASGTFGWTSGPWQYFPDSTATEPTEGGHYATVWQKQANGSWRALIDIGIEHKIVPLTGIEVHPLAGGQVDQSKRSGPEDYERAVANAERILSRRSEGRGARAALLAMLDVDALILRDNHLPAIDRSAQHDILESEAGTASWKPTAIRVSPHGDLAFTYGTGTAKKDKRRQQFYYVRVWRNVAGIWRVALDVRTWAAPEQKPKSEPSE